MRGMERYRRLRVFAMVAVAVEFLVGLAGTLTPRREIFPFASWFLFSLVPAQTSDYDILVHPPQGSGATLPFSQAGDLVRSSHSIVSYQLIQQLGRAEELRDHELIGRLRQQIEPRFRVAGIRYELVKVTYAPIPRWVSGKVTSQTTVATFTAGEPEGGEAKP